MRRLIWLAALAVAGALASAQAAAAAPPAGGEVIRAWNDLAFSAVRSNNASDAQAARMYAMVDAAMYDAVNGTAGGAGEGGPRGAAIVAAETPAPGDAAVAAAAAARDVLYALYPNNVSDYDTRLAQDMAAARSATSAVQGRDWGGQVAAQVLAARSGDGSSPNETQAPGSGPGAFPNTWSGVQFRNLEPFAIDDPGAYVSSGPPSLGSAEYAAAFNEVKVLGNAALSDPAKLATFRYWSLAGGTNQPPGAWLQVAQAASASRSLSLPDTARLFALESMALADTVAPTYTTKYVFHSWRPTTAIRQADTDGNPDTTADPTWSARAGSAGSSPEHWSGHSTFSAAGAAVLSGFFCTDAVPFTLVTDSAPGGQARSYDGFSQAAAEAGRSRVLGGLHFEFSNGTALQAGRAVASEVLATALQPKDQSAHAGDCPR